MYSRKLLIGLCAAALTGCSPYPIVPDSLSPAPTTLLEAKRLCMTSPINCTFVDASNKALQASILGYQTKAGDRDWWTQGFKDGTFWGSLSAAAGGIAHKVALLNTGVGVAAISTAADGRYATKSQAELLATSINVATCYLNKMAVIDDPALQALLQSDPAKTDYYATVSTMMNGIVERFQKLHASLTTNLREMSTTSYTTDQLIAIVNGSKPTTPPANPPDPGKKALAGVQTVVTFANPLNKTPAEITQENAAKTDAIMQIAQWAANAKSVLPSMDTCIITTK